MHELLPPPRRLDVLRPQRRGRPALRLPRLEVRRKRHLRRHAVEPRKLNRTSTGLSFCFGRSRAISRRHAHGVRDSLLLAQLLLAGVSTFWSIPMLTPHFAARSGSRSTMGFGFYLAWRYSWAQLLEVIGGAYVVLIAGSYIVTILAPSIGKMPFEHPGSWRRALDAKEHARRHHWRSACRLPSPHQSTRRSAKCSGAVSRSPRLAWCFCRHRRRRWSQPCSVLARCGAAR